MPDLDVPLAPADGGSLGPGASIERTSNGDVSLSSADIAFRDGRFG